VTKPILTQPEAAYIEEIYRQVEKGLTPSVSRLATKFGVKMPSAVEMLDKLEKKGFIVRRPWKTPKITLSGRALAENIVHNHRIIEIYFTKKLGLDSDFCCEEATKIDNLIGDEVVSRMCVDLSHPDESCHGIPIKHVYCKKISR